MLTVNAAVAVEFGEKRKFSRGQLVEKTHQRVIVILPLSDLAVISINYGS